MISQSASGNQTDPIFMMIMFLVIGIGIFLALRPVMLWYYNINEMIKNQQKEISLLGRILNEIVESNDHKKEQETTKQ